MKTSEESLTSHPAANPPRSREPLRRFAGVGALVALIAGLFLYAGGWMTPHRQTPASIVNTLEQVNGLHPGFRRNHAKGVCVTGYFESNGQGRSISKAQVFVPARVPILGRFALSGGQPYIADTPQIVRSLAILFQLTDGEEWRTAMINLPVFTVNTAQGFNDLQLASARDPVTGKPNPAATAAFLAKHPETVAAQRIIASHPFSSGFADSPYYGLDAFRFINARGESTAVRWSFVPEQTFEKADADASRSNYLFDALIAQIHSNRFAGA